MRVVKVSVPMQEQIFLLKSQGLSNRKIAKALQMSRDTVSKIITRGEVVETGAERPQWTQKIDWQKVHLEVSRGVQLNILAREFAGGNISYVQFWREYHRQHPNTPNVTMRLQHKPGEKCFFDYAEGINIVDHSTGEVTKTWFLCGVMAMSSMTFGEFTLTQKRDELMRSIERSFRFFGGVTPYVTVDNQKAAVDVAHWYDPDVNPAFVDFANHWGFAVIPARPRRPQDKGANECSIGVVQRQFYQEVRDRTFYSLGELNEAFKIYLKRLNESQMKDWGVSRAERFVGEFELLKPCPAENWEPSEWREPKVHADCHIQVLKKFYSVPYKYVGQSVRVRVSAKMIEVFDKELTPLCAHARLLGKELKSTEESHYPAEKMALTQFSVQLAKREAHRLGPETEKLVSHLLDVAYPLRHLRRVQGILRLSQSHRVSREALEHGCKMALTFNKLNYRYVQSAAEHFDRNGNRPRLVGSAPVREVGSIFLHNPITEENKDDE